MQKEVAKSVYLWSIAKKIVFLFTLSSFKIYEEECAFSFYDKTVMSYTLV